MPEPLPPPAPVPHAVSWNLTQRCNLRCAHCYLDATQRSGSQPHELSPAESAAVVDQLAELNPHLVLILTGGEPLLHPELPALIRRAARAGMTPVLGTNGTRLRPAMARVLRESGLRGCGVSLDSTDPAAHDHVRGVPGAWRRTVEGLGVLREVGLPFVVQPSIFSWNRHEIRALAELALKLGAESVNFYFLVCTGRGQDVTDLSSEQYEEALLLIARLQAELGGKLMVTAKCAPHQKRVAHQLDPDSPFVAGYAGGCPAATHYLRIGPRGEVSPCPYIPSEGASLRERRLTEIWASEPQLTLLRDRGALEGRCGACEYRELCGGCRARAQAATGSPLAEDPSCRYEPRGGAAQGLAPERTFGGEVRFTLPWTAAALARLEAVPSFLRAMLVRRLEDAARAAGDDRVDAERMREARKRARERGFAPPGSVEEES